MSKSSLARLKSRGAPVIIEEPAEPLTSADAADMVVHGSCARDQLVRQALMVTFAVVVRDELRDRPAEMTFTDWDHPVEALFLD